VFFKTILLRKESAGGGSTITQQLAKNMYGRVHSGLFPVLVNKLKESMLARRIERTFNKEQILNLYFNTVPFGENVYGIEAASLRYFNKRVEQLRIEESAVLVGMLKANHLYNPRLYPEKATERRNIVLRLMQKQDCLDKGAADSLSMLPLKLNYLNIEYSGPADYFLFQVRTEAEDILQHITPIAEREWDIEEDGLIITTTLDLDLQKHVNQAFREHLSVMQKRINKQYLGQSGRRFMNSLVKSELKRLNLTRKADEIAIRQVFNWNGNTVDSMSVTDSLKQTMLLLHAGLLAMDPVSGEIRAWAGGIDFKTQPYDQVLAVRQTGSTFKPILYATALEDGFSPCTYLDNDSLVVPEYDDWSPDNFDHTFGGKYSLTGALVRSMNIPSFNLFRQLDFNQLDDLWQNMGFSYKLVNTPALSMGTAEASIQELAVAYSVFANGGFRVVPQKILSIKSADGHVIWENEPIRNRKSILSERTCRLISAILQKAVWEGTGSAIRSTYGITLPLAGKTGTTQDYADAWFAAYNPSLVIVSRVGASLPSIHFNSNNGTGSALALPIVALTLKKAQDNKHLEPYIRYFPELDTELAFEFGCPDFKEENILDELQDLFSNERISYDTLSNRRARRMRSFIRRIFHPD